MFSAVSITENNKNKTQKKKKGKKTGNSLYPTVRCGLQSFSYSGY